MRKKLRKLGSVSRHRFSARIGRFGTKKNWNGYPEKTVCIEDVRMEGEDKPLTDHLWFTYGKTWERLDPKEGDLIQFDARVGEYTKGRFWYERETDYSLKWPTNMKILERQGQENPNEDNSQECETTGKANEKETEKHKMNNIQTLPEAARQNAEEPLQTKNTSGQAGSDARAKELGCANPVGDARSSGVNAPKLKVERYTASVNHPGYVDDFDDGDRDEIRYRIVDEVGKVIDDAQGYGYRSAQGARKAMWYKFKGGRQKINREEQTRKQLFRSNPDFEKRYHILCEESNFLYHKYTGIDYSIEDWHRDLKALLEEFKLDLKYFELLV